jgi:hypothetical protein
MSLGNIRRFLEQNRYDKVKYVIWDLSKIFGNVMIYLSVSIYSKNIKHVILDLW